eukprot:9621862-Lingulodinium_polyedra.AAC.1
MRLVDVQRAPVAYCALQLVNARGVFFEMRGIAIGGIVFSVAVVVALSASEIRWRSNAAGLAAAGF